MHSPHVRLLASIALCTGLLLGSTAPVLAAAPPSPTATATVSSVSGNSLSDDQDQGVLSTTTAEYFGTNQQATAAANENFLWWAVAVAGLAIVGLAWLGYRELA